MKKRIIKREKKNTRIEKWNMRGGCEGKDKTNVGLKGLGKERSEKKFWGWGGGIAIAQKNTKKGEFSLSVGEKNDKTVAHKTK